METCEAESCNSQTANRIIRKNHLNTSIVLVVTSLCLAVFYMEAKRVNPVLNIIGVNLLMLRGLHIFDNPILLKDFVD